MNNTHKKAMAWFWGITLAALLVVALIIASMVGTKGRSPAAPQVDTPASATTTAAQETSTEPAAKKPASPQSATQPTIRTETQVQLPPVINNNIETNVNLPKLEGILSPEQRSESKPTIIKSMEDTYRVTSPEGSPLNLDQVMTVEEMRQYIIGLKGNTIGFIKSMEVASEADIKAWFKSNRFVLVKQ